MPSYRFRWDAFSDKTVHALAAAKGFRADPKEAREWLADRVKRPTPDFVGEMKDVLVRYWLPEYAGTEKIVDYLLDAGIGPLGSPRSQNGYVRYVDECRNSKRLRHVLWEAMVRFGDMDAPPDDNGLDFTPRFATLDVKGQPADTRKPHAYQQEAWNRLSAHLAESRSTGVFQGLLVMPTGSGKTYTSVRWLCTNVLAQGKRVLWLAHRHELLSNAAAEFHRLAAYAAPKEKLRVRVVSAMHCATSQIDPADDVVIASVASLARRKDIADALLTDTKLFVVVDEAHHAPAKSYRDILTAVQQRKPWSILGLTATPTRTDESERPVLTRLFGNRVLSQVELPKLIETGILARPIPVVVKTNTDVEAGITEEDRKHHERFNDLSEEWFDRIAHLRGRNAVILEHYLKNRAKYGSTLMFAINVAHAALLTDELKSAGIRADYVASYRPDGTTGDPLRVIQEFREGRLEVLVNVQMVTEGVDLPCIDTVFLTRPTNSEILMRQMIGRALRGPASGGAEKAYLVSFEDHWSTFRDWDSPFALVPDIEAAASPEAPPVGATKPIESEVVDRFVEHLPWETIRAVSSALRLTAPEHHGDAFEAVPEGWLVLERTEEDQGIHIPISVYAHQRVCWEALIAYLCSLNNEQRYQVNTHALYSYYFCDCDAPAPSEHQVALVVEHFRRGGEKPEFHDLQGRSVCDPYKVAEQINAKNLGRRESSLLVERSYTGLAKAIYSDLRQYQTAIDDALFELEHPEEATRVMRAVPIFDPRPDQQLAPGPHHHLHALMQEVLSTGASLLGVGSLTYPGTLEWSHRLLKGWYGMAYIAERPPRIRINCLLNSPDIAANTMKFLLWHEFLHVYLNQGHTATFRELERKWPGMVEADRQLDTLNERFGIQYW